MKHLIAAIIAVALILPLAATPADAADMYTALSNRAVYYKHNSSDLADNEILNFNGMINLRYHARYIKAHPEARVVVEGNCDERESALVCEDRALKVQRFLIMNGATDGNVSVVNNGATKPLGECHEEKCYRQNRRVELKYSYVLR